MTFTVAETPWVSIKRKDPSFRLNSTIGSTDRAYVQITSDCPVGYRDLFAQAVDRGWIECVAAVPKDDPTLLWDTLQKE